MHSNLSVSILISIAGSSFTFGQHDNELYNDGALLHIQAGTEVHVLGDVHMTGATGLLENYGLLKTQGNMYSDAMFQQRGTGTTRIENSDVNTTERQFIAGSYAVRGGTSQIGVDDGSFYNLEVNNSHGAVYLINSGAGGTPQYVADVRNTINFDPQGLGPNYATNIVTHDIGTTGAWAYPANGSGYTAEFGMMNATAGPSNYINDTWHQSWGNNMSTMDKGYIIGKHRRAISPAGGTYGYMLGLDPSTNVANNGNNKGFQYIHFGFGANTYDVLGGYYEAYSPNNTMGAAIECGGYNMDDFWGDRHGEWIFEDINNVNGGEYEVRIWPQDPAVAWAGTVYTISKDDVFEYPAPNPLNNQCGPSAVGLSRNGFNGMGEFGVVGGITIGLGSELINISAEGNKDHIEVSWDVATENNVSHYELERSLDGETFDHLANVPGAGFSSVMQNYSYNDYAVQQGQLYYYRVYTVDFDGSGEHSAIVSGSINNDDLPGSGMAMSLYPNPSTDHFTCSFANHIAGNLSLDVFTITGQLIDQKYIEVPPGDEPVFTINCSSWTPSIYTLRFTNLQNGSVLIKKLSKE